MPRGHYGLQLQSARNCRVKGIHAVYARRGIAGVQPTEQVVQVVFVARGASIGEGGKLLCLLLQLVSRNAIQEVFVLHRDVVLAQDLSLGDFVLQGVGLALELGLSSLDLLGSLGVRHLLLRLLQGGALGRCLLADASQLLARPIRQVVLGGVLVVPALVALVVGLARLLGLDLLLLVSLPTWYLAFVGVLSAVVSDSAVSRSLVLLGQSSFTCHPAPGQVGGNSRSCRRNLRNFIAALFSLRQVPEGSRQSA